MYRQPALSSQSNKLPETPAQARLFYNKTFCRSGLEQQDMVRSPPPLLEELMERPITLVNRDISKPPPFSARELIAMALLQSKTPCRLS